MKMQLEIENSWDVAKFLITNIDHKMLLFKLPQYGLYLQSLVPIPVAYESNAPVFQIRFGEARHPHIATVRFPVGKDQEENEANHKRISNFIQDNPELKAYRIFKHGLVYRDIKKRNVIGLVCDTTKNMLTLFPGKTFRIDSKNKNLRDIFYKKAVEINEQDKLGCSFDYDEYDYTLEIRTYKRFKEEVYIKLGNKIERIVKRPFHRWAVVTILYGKDLPNSWSMGSSVEGG